MEDNDDIKNEIKENNKNRIEIKEDKKQIQEDKNEINIIDKKEIEDDDDEDNNNILNHKKDKNEINEQFLEEENSDEPDEPEYSKNDIEALYLRTKTNKTMKIEEFYEQKKHYL